MKTFIRQPGNKTKYIRHIIPHIPTDYNTYFEPFAGSGAIFLHLAPKKWIINDINEDLINLYKTIKDDLPGLVKSIKSFEKRTDFDNISNEEKLLLLQKYMSTFIKLPYNTKRAAYYVILKMAVYMGAILLNGKYVFQGLDMNLVKGGKFYIFKKTYLDNLEKVNTMLNSNGKIFNTDYKQVLKKAKPGDFCFIDSPYDELNDYQFTYNTSDKDKNDFVEELYIELQKLDKKNVRWLMTQADTKQVRKRFKEYTIVTFPVFRGFSNTYKNELIIKNY